MNKDRLLRFINEQESWAQIKSPDTDIMSGIRSRAIDKHQKMARALYLFKIMSASLGVLVLALLIGLFSRTSSQSSVVLVYPAMGNEESVVLTLGDKDLEMKYDPQQKVFVKKINNGNQAVSNMKITVKSKEVQPLDKSPSEYLAGIKNIQKQKDISMESLVIEDDARTANNQDNELDGVYIPGLDENLLASAKLTF